MRYDWVVVGAGLVGCTLAERIATVLGQRVLVVEAREHIGGNTFDELDEHGVLVHRYGPHAFHTNDSDVWGYLSQFTNWSSYQHRVLAEVDGRLVPVPFNLNTLDMLFSRDQASLVRGILLATYGAGQEIPILRLRESPQREIRKFADFVYDKIYYGYTVKQWSLTPEQLGPAVMGRVRVRLSRDDHYFRDRYQAIPAQGYTAMVRRILSHKYIDVALNTPFDSVRGVLTGCRWIYTGSVDSFFAYLHGALPYRSLRFESAYESRELVQPVAQINYPTGQNFTRVVEHKHITGQKVFGTTITREYPEIHKPGKTEPYYPIPVAQNLVVYAKYRSEMAKVRGKVIFVGRLADYKYYNMDQAIARALCVFERDVIPLAVYSMGATIRRVWQTTRVETGRPRHF